MTQSIHFDSREKKVLGLTPTRGPSEFCLKMFVKNKFNQTKHNIYTKKWVLYIDGGPVSKKEKKGWDLHLDGGPWSNLILGFERYLKRNPNSLLFQRIIKLNMDIRCMCEYKHIMIIKQY